jgi:hypothetical protein
MELIIVLTTQTRTMYWQEYARLELIFLSIYNISRHIPLSCLINTVNTMTVQLEATVTTVLPVWQASKLTCIACIIYIYTKLALYVNV